LEVCPLAFHAAIRIFELSKGFPAEVRYSLTLVAAIDDGREGCATVAVPALRLGRVWQLLPCAVLDSGMSPQALLCAIWSSGRGAALGAAPSDRAAAVRQPARLLVGRPAPTLGQHTDEPRRELLGVSDVEIGELGADGIIGDWPVLL